MARFAARALYEIAHASGLHHLGRRAHRRRLLIVCYHGLRPDESETRHWLLLPRSTFESQIAFLARHYDCLPIDEALDRLWRDELDTPTACVTFDDGYRNNLELGLPILRRYGVPATVYLATGLIGTDERLWTTALELAFERTHLPRIDLPAWGLGTVELAGIAERRRVARIVVEALKHVPVSERRERHAALLATLVRPSDGPLDGAGAFSLMDWREVRSLGASGLVTFGGHTEHHEIVSRLDGDDLEAEVAGSIRAVRREVPDAVSATFAYPNGGWRDYDARAEALVAAQGCAAVTTIAGLNSPATPRTRLARLVVSDNTLVTDFAVRAAALGQLVAR